VAPPAADPAAELVERPWQPMLRSMRKPGDRVFLLGVFAFARFVVGLWRGWSEEPAGEAQTSRTPDAGVAVTTAASSARRALPRGVWPRSSAARGVFAVPGGARRLCAARGPTPATHTSNPVCGWFFEGAHEARGLLILVPEVIPMAKTAGGGAAIDIGIEAKDREAIAGGLAKLLADSYTLYLKTHNFHWNVTGPMFNTLHLMFEGQYTELALAVDLIAERIRALGIAAPGSYAQFSNLSSVKEETGVPATLDMVRQLVEGQETVARTAREAFPVAERASDQVTMDLLTQRLQVHEKNAWMLRSLLE